VDTRWMVTKVVTAVRKEGFSSAFRKVIVHFTRRSTDDFDKKHGTDTARIEQLWELKIDSPNARFGLRYEAAEEQEVVDFVNFLHEDPQTLTFIDLGCGKGRTLLLASSLGFKQVIGVEFAQELVEIAKANLAKMKVTNAVVEHLDAAEYRFPDSDLVVFLNNPFLKEVMEKVVANLGESRTKKLYVVYRVANFAEVFDSSGFLKRWGFPPTRPHIQIWKGAN
jgi:SAM-dependent methyltransferase